MIQELKENSGGGMAAMWLGWIVARRLSEQRSGEVMAGGLKTLEVLSLNKGKRGKLPFRDWKAQ